VLELSQQRRKIKHLQRTDGCFPPPFRTETLDTGILVCPKRRLKACCSDPFSEIVQVHALDRIQR